MKVTDVEILDWYDGPMRGKCKVDGKEYWFHYHTEVDFEGPNERRIYGLYENDPIIYENNVAVNFNDNEPMLGTIHEDDVRESWMCRDGKCNRWRNCDEKEIE